ncbi:MAG: response regulator, partial [Blastocatellia bacterium]|nr:response regulator [Blastocatellia bacterium]
MVMKLTGRFIFRLALFLLLVLVERQAFALDPTKEIIQYGHDIWVDELPQNSVHTIIQTKDRYLWLGTFEGLVRFDGVRFTVFDKLNTPEMMSNYVFCLAEDSSNNLWIGTVSGGLVRFRNGKFTHYGSKEGINDYVYAAFEDSNQNMWFATDAGLVKFRDEKFTTYTTKDGLSGNEVRDIVEDREGRLWIATATGLTLFRDGKFTIYTTKDGLVRDSVSRLLYSRKGDLWIGTKEGLSLFRGEKFLTFSDPLLLKSHVRSMFEDKNGSLWLGTDSSGLIRISGDTEKVENYAKKDGLTNDGVGSIFEDLEGSLWVGTNGGLNRFKDNKFDTYSTKNGLESDFVRTVFEDSKGNIWIGSDGGGLSLLSKDGKITTYGLKDGLSNINVKSLFETEDGTLLVGTSGGGINFLKDGKFTHYISTRDGLSNNNVRAICKDRQGYIWVGTDGGGINRIKDGKIEVFTIKEGLSNNSIRSIYEDKKGNLWIGTYLGLNLYKDGKFIVFTTAQGLSSNIILTIYEDAAGDMWLGTNGGLNRYRNSTFKAYTVKDGMFDDTTFQVLEDNQGHLWLSCNKGIYTVKKQDLDDFDNGKIKAIQSTAYGKADGMGSSQCNGASQPAGCRSRDGRLWFPTVKGAVSIDPNNLQSNLLKPTVLIEEIMVDGKEFRLSMPLKTIEFSPNNEKYEIHYTGLSFLYPNKVRFKYILEGYDHDWTEPISRRIAYYNNLPPGKYTFKVVASNNDGLWNETGASFSFFIPTPLWRTWWAYLFYVFGSAGLIYGVVQIRLQALRRGNELLQQKVNERTAELDKKNRELDEKLRLLESSRLEIKQRTDELAETVEQLKLSEQKAQEANQAKSAFLSSMSHELRTPLNAILGFVQLIEKDRNLTDEQRENLAIILRSGEHLLSLINDVLSISKIEAGKLTLQHQPFDFKKLLRSLQDMISMRAESKGLKLVFEVSDVLPRYVMGDESKLRQVLINLLGNAVKFTEKGSITLRVAYRAEQAYFEVEDTGQGIEDRELRHLFEPFFQTATGRKSKEGTGLGLAISRNIIQLMGGDIEVISKVKQGTTFSFAVKLPVAQDVSGLRKTNRKALSMLLGQTNKKILIVDDKWENRVLLTKMLSSVGFQVNEASDGREAVRVWEQWQPDFIWMDIRMPEMDGYEATKAIRAREKELKRPRTVIVALTASVFMTDREAVFAAGCDDFVPKPFQEERIFEKLTEKLGTTFLYEERVTGPLQSIIPEMIVTPARLEEVPAELLTQL